MNWIRTRLYGKAANNSSGGGSPGGAANSIQYNDAGSFGGFGEYDAANDTLTLGKIEAETADGSGTRNSGTEIRYDNEEDHVRETIARKAAYTGGASSNNIYNATDNTIAPDGSTFVVEANVVAYRTDAAGGGFSYTLRAMFRKTAGVVSIVGASAQTNAINGTGDAFSGTPSLSTNGAAVFHNIDLTTVKTFRMAVFTKIWLVD